MTDIVRPLAREVFEKSWRLSREVLHEIASPPPSDAAPIAGRCDSDAATTAAGRGDET
jgi:hypothetical protein